MEEKRFDALARSSAASPRRRVLGGLVAVMLGGFAATRAGADADAACKGNSCGGKVRRCGKKGRHCYCHKRPGGGHVCASANGVCPLTDCASDLDCPAQTVCVKSGRRCCPQNLGLQTACAFVCGVTPQSTAALTTSRRYRAR